MPIILQLKEKLGIKRNQQIVKQRNGREAREVAYAQPDYTNE